ncbi:MAG TPA: LssY C-terminal domain-containing protein [Bryobacteraceae bacterium]|nr:LssY C-terminal domain-containing protein [Bryobacteraceae bacterium]
MTPLSSYNSKKGDPVAAEITSSVCLDGRPLPAATLRGEVARVHAVSIGVVHETASLKLKLSRLELADGSAYPVTARLTAVDNARERVDRSGVIHGIRATATLSSRFASHLFFAAGGHPALAIPTLALETWFFRFPEPEIEYAPGTGLEIELAFPEALGHAALCSERAPDPVAAAEWQDLVAGLPAWSYSKGHEPIDRVNLLFIGSLSDLERAFQASGWTGSQPQNLRTGFRAFRALAEARGFADAPMRTLLLDDAPPDLRMQRSLNTFDKRDHMRIWMRPEEWQGRDVWAASATQDLAAVFTAHPPGVTHRIEADVDLEREKVLRELEFAGCVDKAMDVARPPAETETKAETRRGLLTDSRVAVILLKPCDNPVEEVGAGPGQESAPSGGPPKDVRVIRRVVLTARNHFLRDNVFWRSADVLRFTWRRYRAWEAAKRERIAYQAGLLAGGGENPLGAEGR